MSANPQDLYMQVVERCCGRDCLARILKLVGFNVTREYYINDAGNQIDVLIKSVQLRYLDNYLEKCKYS